MTYQCMGGAGALRVVKQGLFIDHFGKFRYGANLATSAAQVTPNYAVKNQGWIQIIQKPQRVRVTLRLAVCSELAIARLLFWLADGAPRRLQMFAFDDSTDEFSCVLLQEKVDVSQIASWIQMANSERELATRRTSLDPDRLKQECRFAKVVKMWRQMNGNLVEGEAGRTTSLVLGNRFVLLKRDKESDGMILLQVGSGMPAFAARTLQQMIGRRYEDHPDHRYGVACVEAYEQALAQWKPVVEHVDAVVTWPGYGRMRRTYSRLILPCKCFAHGSVVLCSTLPTSDAMT